jgi:4'-phosphopantetheinyl transferase
MSFPSFTFPPSKLELASEEIHIWCTELDQPLSRIEMLAQILCMDERNRAERFHFEEHKNRFIIRHGILRSILECYLGTDPSRLRFCYGKNGKPKLGNTGGEENIRFNLSHSESLALYSFTRDCEVGVDIEHIRDIPEMDQIAERFFSVRENDVFRALPEGEKKEAFFNCWTRKEAFIKANGDGLFRPLDKFDVSLVPGEPARLLRIEGDSKEASRWSIQDLKPASGFAAAFAVKVRRWQLYCWQWPG